MFKNLTLATLFVGVATIATAQEEPVSQTLPIAGGVICDTQEQVVDTISNTEENGSLSMVDGCGVLRIPLLAEVVLLGEYQTNKSRFMLAEYNFKPNPFGLYVQYGWWGFPQPLVQQSKGEAL